MWRAASLSLLGLAAVLSLGFVLGSLTLPVVAHAQTDASSDSEARRYYTDARTAYEAGDFEAAVRNFRRAYLLSPRYPLLYNIGQAEMRAGHDGLALEAFEGFLRQAPPGDEHRGEVEERVRMLRSMGVRPATEAEVGQAQQQAGGGTVTGTGGTGDTGTSGSGTGGTGTSGTGTSGTGTSGTGTSGTGTSGTGSSDGGPGFAPWIVVGAGGAVLVVGAVLMGVASSDASRVTNAMDGASWSDLRGVASGAQTLWGVGIAMLGVGIAAAGAGLVWALLPSGDGSSGARASARLRLTPSSIFVEGEF